jgi:hypothetical protein
MITAVFCVMVAIIAFSVTREIGGSSGRRSSCSNRGRRVTRAVACLAIILGISCGIAYLNLFNLLVISDNQQIQTEIREIRIVIGTELRDELRGTTQEPLELLRDNGYDPERVWTRGSLLRSRFLVFGFFLAMFLLVTLGLGLLAALAEAREHRSET